jgi:hypothetical protein
MFKSMQGNDKDFELCRFSGFQFSLNNANEREVLRKWVELEINFQKQSE